MKNKLGWGARFKLMCALCFIAFTSLLPNTSYAWDDNSGCRIVLCLANPKGPMAEEKCRKDIRDFFRAVAKGKSYPSCHAVKLDSKNPVTQQTDGTYKANTVADGLLADKGTFFKLGYDNYALCPAGTTDSRKLGLDNKYVGVLKPVKESGVYKDVFGSRGYDTGVVNRVWPLEEAASSMSYQLNNPKASGGFDSNGGVSPTSLACVGNQIRVQKVCSSYRWCNKNDDNYAEIDVNLFDKIVYRKYNPNSFIADIYIDNKIWQRTRLSGNQDEGDDNGVTAEVESAN